MKTVFVSDLDGTLITRNERLSDYSLSVLNGLIERGLPFTYATARSLSSAERSVGGLRHTLPVIVYNGALIIRPATGEVLHFLSFSGAEKARLVEKLASFGVSPSCTRAKTGRIKFSGGRAANRPGQARYLARRMQDRRLTPCAFRRSSAAGSPAFSPATASMRR